MCGFSEVKNEILRKKSIISVFELQSKLFALCTLTILVYASNCMKRPLQCSLSILYRYFGYMREKNLSLFNLVTVMRQTFESTSNNY